MNQSDSIAELASSLAKAQGEIQGAKKDCANPFFKSKYADLSSVWDACRDPLTKNGLSVIQTTGEKEGNTYLFTTLAHSSGQWIRSELKVITGKPDIQALGSSLTYCRRYSLSMIVGVCPEDDDGNAASQAPQSLKTQGVLIQTQTIEKITSDKAVHLSSMLAKCSKEFSESITAYMRNAPINAPTIQELPASHYDAIIGHINKHLSEATRKNAA